MSLSPEPECFPGHFALLTYLTERENWSYYEFLTTYRDVVISSPPFSEEWNGLDGAWTHRFLRKAKEFKPNDHENLKNKVDSERSNKGLQAYWEEVIYIRKKLAVKRTHVLGSLSILDKAGKYNVGNVISERLSDSFHVDVSPTSKHILDSTSSEKTKKIRNEESCQGENDEKRKQTKRHKEQKKKSFSKTRGDVLPNGDETGYETTLNDNDEDEEALPSEDSLTFAFNSSKAWDLPSGQNVGDIYAKKISENARAIKDKKRLTATEKAILRYGASRLIDLSAHMNKWFCDKDKKFIKKNYESILQFPEMIGEENSFVLKVEDMVRKGDVDKAYKYCMEIHSGSEENSYLYKITKIYGDFIYKSKDQADILDFTMKSAHTEIDVILKACAYIIEGLNKNLVIYPRWGESFCPLSKSADHINGRKCDVRFLTRSGVDVGEWEFSAKATATKFAGTSGQLLIEDLIEGFYIVFPGPKFELPTKLKSIGKLKTCIGVIKSVMDMYVKTCEITENLETLHNEFDDIFDDDDTVKPITHKLNDINFKIENNNSSQKVIANLTNPFGSFFAHQQNDYIRKYRLRSIYKTWNSNFKNNIIVQFNVQDSTMAAFALPTISDGSVKYIPQDDMTVIIEWDSIESNNIPIKIYDLVLEAYDSPTRFDRISSPFSGNIPDPRKECTKFE
ncbi:5625_t:CDS:10 [Gigaspora rosea]|nr:5625_t:CDS:10 [Gigaspora rosea]